MRIRNSRGNQLAEFPVALMVLVIFVFFTLADMSTLVLGFNSVHNAARTGATDAARATGFAEMQTRANKSVSAIVGSSVHVSSVDVGVFQVPIKKTVKDDDGNAETLVTSQIKPGPKPSINTSLYQYQTQVTVTGSVNPLVNFDGFPGLSGIPGVGAPLVITAKYTNQTENPKGLMLN